MNTTESRNQKVSDVVLVALSRNSKQLTFARVGEFVDFKTEKLRRTHCHLIGAGPYQFLGATKIRRVGKVLFLRCEDGEKAIAKPELLYRVPESEMTRPLTHEEMVLYFESRPEFAAFKDDPAEICRTICEFDVLLQYSTYLEVSTNKIHSKYYSEYVIQEMIRARTFLARYIGLPADPPIPAVQC